MEINSHARNPVPLRRRNKWTPLNLEALEHNPHHTENPDIHQEAAESGSYGVRTEATRLRARPAIGIRAGSEENETNLSALWEKSVPSLRCKQRHTDHFWLQYFGNNKGCP